MRLYSFKFFLGLILVFSGSCKKDGTSNANSTSILGKWELKETMGMTPTTEYPPGNGNMLKYSDSAYEMYTNNNLVKSGNYIILEDSSAEAEVGLVIPPGQFTHRIVYDNDFLSHKIFFQISNNKLTFLSGFFPIDGGSKDSYQRIE
jgi:hypothetical protein